MRSEYSVQKRHLTRNTIYSVVAFVSVAVCVFFAAKLLLNEKPVEEQRGSLEGRFQEAVTYTWQDQVYRYRNSEITTILMVGIDSRKLPEKNSIYRNGVQADYMLLLVVDRANRSIVPVQIDRDTVTAIDIYGVLGNRSGTRKTQLSLAEGYGNSVETGTKNLAKAISRYLLGIPIDHYVVYDMDFINRFNNLIGGVEVTVTDDLSAADPTLIAGTTIKLNGDQAETFVRARRNVADSTNVNRMNRQREFISGAMKVLNAHFDEMIVRLMDELADDYSSNLSRAAMINLVNRIGTYDVKEYVDFVGERIVGEDGYREFHPDTNSLRDTVLQMCFAAK